MSIKHKLSIHFALFGMMTGGTLSTVHAAPVGERRPQFLVELQTKRISDEFKKGQLLQELTNRNSYKNNNERLITSLQMPITEELLNDFLSKIRKTWIGGVGQSWQLRDPGPVVLYILPTSQYIAQMQNIRGKNILLVSFGILRDNRYYESELSEGDFKNETTDDEVYWILAHEFSHLALDHVSKISRMNQSKSEFCQPTERSKKFESISPERNSSSQKSSGSSETMSVSEDAIKMKYCSPDNITDIQQVYRNLEDEADISSADLLHSLGYSEVGYENALYKIGNQDLYALKRAQIMGRMSNLFSQSALLALIVQNKPADWVGKFLESLASMSTDMEKIFANDLNRSHRSSRTRMSRISKYIREADIANGWAPVSRTEHLRNLYKSQEFLEAEIVVRGIDAAKKSIESGNFSTALAIMAPVAKGRFADSPTVANIMGFLYAAIGKIEAAESWYDRAASFGCSGLDNNNQFGTEDILQYKIINSSCWSESVSESFYNDSYYMQNVNGFHAHVDLLIRTRRFSRALSIITETRRRFGDDNGFLPQLVQIHMLTNNGTALVAAIARCEHLRSEKIARQCLDALGRDTQVIEKLEISHADRERLKNSISELRDVAGINAEKTRP